MISAFLLFLLLGAGLGAVVYAGVGLILVALFCREKIGWRCRHCRKRTLELIWWLESYPASSPAYFECANCHARVSYVRPGPWKDASDAKFDKYYDGSVPASINTRRARRPEESARPCTTPHHKTSLEAAHAPGTPERSCACTSGVAPDHAR